MLVGTLFFFPSSFTHVPSWNTGVYLYNTLWQSDGLGAESGLVPGRLQQARIHLCLNVG